MCNHNRIEPDPYEVEASKFLLKLFGNNFVLGNYYYCHHEHRLQLPIYSKNRPAEQTLFEVRDNKHNTRRKYILYYFFIDGKEMRIGIETRVSTDTEIDAFDTPTLSALEKEIEELSNSPYKKYKSNEVIKNISSWLNSRPLKHI